jgi:hypothetical protein
MSVFINMRKSIDITNKQFGNLLALNYSHTNKVEYWNFKCLLCDNLITTRKPDVTRGRTKSCGCKKNVGKNNGNWHGYEDINGRTLGHYKKMAEKRKIDFDITIENLWEIYIKQDKKCPYTGVELLLTPNTKQNRTPSNASLDRINSNLGYVVGNIQWVLKELNVMKNTMSHNEFINICCLIADNHRFKKGTPIYL